MIDEFSDPVRPEHKGDYVTTNTRRVMNMFNHVSMGCNRQRPPRWALALSWMKGGAPNAQREPKVQCAPPLIYDFDKWAMCARRCDANKSHEQRNPRRLGTKATRLRTQPLRLPYGPTNTSIRPLGIPRQQLPCMQAGHAAVPLRSARYSSKANPQ